MQTTTANREALILEYYPLARAIARRVHRRLPREVELDDLVGAAVSGLVDAVDRFDADRPATFKAFARQRIHGAVVDALRATDFVPRTVRRRNDLLERTRRKLREQNGAEPTRDAIATALEVSPKRLEKLERHAHIRTLVSLDAPNGDGLAPVDQLASDDDLLGKWQDRDERQMVLDAIEELPEREKTAVALYYLHELSLKEVGSVLGVTESRACQLCSQAVRRLRARLGVRAAA